MTVQIKLTVFTNLMMKENISSGSFLKTPCHSLSTSLLAK